jgi:beta-glucanase (GH16 family)
MRTSTRFFLQFIVVLALLIGGLEPSGKVRSAYAQTWTLVWSDEFNGTGQPSSSNWNYHVGNGWNGGLPGFQGWGNGEWEWYRPENCYQSGGNLVLKAEYFSSPTSIGGRNWYQRSCRITTDTKRSITYGKIEARIQLPNANGSWPAFWMMGDVCDDTSTSNYGAPLSYYDTMATNWASCGEVDIMEHRNSESTIYNNIYWDLRTGVFPWTAGQNANYATNYNAGNVAAFHTYGIEWDQSYIRWFYDGVQTHIIDIRPGTLEEFRKPFHLILNLALAGQFPGMDPTQSQFPLYMNVDYVRVYEAGGGGPGVVFYQDINYGGAASGAKGKGDYAVLPGDVGNDWMSSLRVPSGWTVQAFEHGNFQGSFCTFTSDTSWVGAACNDKMSSFKIF